jgi:hypothetical protein
MNGIEWRRQMFGCPSQAWAFVYANDMAYGLVLSVRGERGRWRGFLVPEARTDGDLWGGVCVWSRDALEEAGLGFHEEQLGEAQAALVRVLAARLGLPEDAIKGKGQQRMEARRRERRTR